jgi:hypothetical protein
MSSLLERLKALVSASVRAPRRYETKPEPPAETLQDRTILPEVTEASHRQQKLPEVSEAEANEALSHEKTSTASEPRRQVEALEDEELTDQVEEERIVDLLEDKKA